MPSPSNGSATGMRAATLASSIFIPKAQGKDKLALLSQVSLGQDVYGGCIHVLKNTDLLKNESVSMFQFKGIVHPKMKVLSLITHPHVVPNLRSFLEHKVRYF